MVTDNKTIIEAKLCKESFYNYWSTEPALEMLSCQVLVGTLLPFLVCIFHPMHMLGKGAESVPSTKVLRLGNKDTEIATCGEKCNVHLCIGAVLHVGMRKSLYK